MPSKSLVVTFIIFGIFVDSVTTNIVLPFLPDLITNIGGTSYDLGIIISLNAFGEIAGSLAFGYLGTYHSHKLLLPAGLILSFLPNLMMAAIQSYWTLAIGRFLQGAASGSIWVSGLALLAESDGKDDSGSSLAWVFSSSNFGGMLAPIIAGYLYNSHPSLPFLLLAALCLGELVLLTMTYHPESFSQDENDDSASFASLLKNDQIVQSKSTLKLVLSLLKNYRLSLLLAFTFLIVTLGMAMFVILVLHLSVFYDLSADKIGLCFLAIAPPQVFACIIGGFLCDKCGFKFTILISLFFGVIASWGLVLPLPLVPFLTFMATFVSSCMILITPIVPEIAILVSEDCSSLAFSMFNISNSAGVMIGPILGSFMYTYFGFGKFMVSMAAVRLLLMFVVSLYQSPQSENEVPSVVVV